MKIDVTGKTPIYIYPRDNNSVILMQGSSHIKLSRLEIDLLIRALMAEDE